MFHHIYLNIGNIHKNKCSFCRQNIGKTIYTFDEDNDLRSCDNNSDSDGDYNCHYISCCGSDNGQQ